MSGVQARRATIDDLPNLRGLWRAHNLPVDDLERRLTEFQLVESASGELIAAVALQIEKHHGKLHSLAISPNHHEPQAPNLLWERVQSVARNNGLVRLWQSKGNALVLEPFENPTPGNIQKAPPTFTLTLEDSITLQLREETAAAALSLDQEFALFAQSERESSARVIERGRRLRVVAYVIALSFLAVVIGLFFYVFRGYSTARPSTERSAPRNSPATQTNAPSSDNQSPHANR